jgi:acyl-CoA dehydrogenase
VREIEKMGRKAVDSNMLFIDNLRVPVRIASAKKAAVSITSSTASIPSASSSPRKRSGSGHAALERAAEYARTRIVFDRPIGQNQAIQHALAECWMALEAGEPDGVQGCQPV